MNTGYLSIRTMEFIVTAQNKHQYHYVLQERARVTDLNMISESLIRILLAKRGTQCLRDSQARDDSKCGNRGARTNGRHQCVIESRLRFSRVGHLGLHTHTIFDIFD